MAIGDRIKRVRNFRKMTMKELGMAVGFDESSADVRIAQYENNSRKPKEELLRKIAEALNVSYHYLALSEPSCAADVMYTLFEVDELYSSVHLPNVVDDTDPDYPENRVGVCFNALILQGFLKEWQLRKAQLHNGEITKEEYMEWKLGWPNTADDCGRHTPSKAWRKNE